MVMWRWSRSSFLFAITFFFVKDFFLGRKESKETRSRTENIKRDGENIRRNGVRIG